MALAFTSDPNKYGISPLLVLLVLLHYVSAAPYPRLAGTSRPWLSHRLASPITPTILFIPSPFPLHPAVSRSFSIYSYIASFSSRTPVVRRFKSYLPSSTPTPPPPSSALVYAFVTVTVSISLHAASSSRQPPATRPIGTLAFLSLPSSLVQLTYIRVCSRLDVLQPSMVDG
ncbi:hypothetical protein B0H19DRAFT_1260373 [Mycena capillaripes]|nr:hypothetical protein B0H19DRAFT_1260373 [Mycena capillaripes]